MFVFYFIFLPQHFSIRIYVYIYLHTTYIYGYMDYVMTWHSQLLTFSSRIRRYQVACLRLLLIAGVCIMSVYTLFRIIQYITERVCLTECPNLRYLMRIEHKFDILVWLKVFYVIYNVWRGSPKCQVLAAIYNIRRK